MMIHDVTALAGRYKSRKRIGRGYASRGKTSGRGHKGQGSRSGYSRRHQFEGGQMPYFRSLAKFGFSNVKFSEPFFIVNLRDIVRHPAFAEGGEVNAETLSKAGLLRDTSRSLKVLGDVGEAGRLSVKLDVSANRVSARARQLIEEAGGSVTETGTRRERVRGVDRNGADRTPKNLSKKRALYEKSRASRTSG